MDCGIPFCHQGCPLGNLIPDWNDLVYRDQWRAAIERLHSTNNFPEFTGKLCPAPCEASCVLGINSDPVAIKQIEASIIERAWNEGWVVPQPPDVKTGKTVAIVGSGPAGLAAAQQLGRAGHSVTVFERADRIGGLLRYGIPDFKMEKRFLDRRIEQMKAEGVVFRPSTNIGVDVSASELISRFDAVCLCGGSTQPRDLPIEGRELEGIYFAMEFLTGQNRRVAGDRVDDKEFISARDKHVVIIGGGDTGADCLGTVHRQKCKSVYQFEIVPRPPDSRAPTNPWPQWSNVFRVSSAHEEGGKRAYSIMTKRFRGKNGKVTELETAQVEMKSDNGRVQFVEKPGTQAVFQGRSCPAGDGIRQAQNVRGCSNSLESSSTRWETSNATPANARALPKVFAAGDMSRGQSLIVWAIAEGRHAAYAIDQFLMGASDLPRPLEYGNSVRPFS